MKYVAIYTSSSSINAAREAAMDLLKRDDYYSKSFDAARFGTKKTVYWDGQCFTVGSQKVSDLQEIKQDVLDEVRVVSWTSCRNNFVEYDFSVEGQVKLTIDSRRHGIPCRALEGMSPEIILEYKTQELDWGVWDTRDDHRA
jgi:hypothetical protein